MAIIRGVTARSMRVTHSLDIGQAVILGLSAALAWAEVRAHAPVPLRVVAVAATAAGGTLAALVRWPPGPLGERLPVWASRLVLHAWTVRQAGGRAAALRADWLAAPSGGCRVWACPGADYASRGTGAREAAEAAYREFLHTLDAPFQVVLCTRFIAREDRPASWDPARVRPELRSVAGVYAEHWAELVEARRVPLRLYLTVLSPEGKRRDARAAQPAADVEGAFLAFAARLGLRPERASATTVAASVAGQRDRPPAPGRDDAPTWSVGAVAGRR